MRKVTVPAIQNYMEKGYNILITGESGTGKTAMLREAAENLGFAMKYYSTSTLDPFADLVGIPVPVQEEKRVEYFRPREIDEAEVLFFDELNRADHKTLNAVFEIIQFRSINGDPLPNLKCVVAAINPVSADYATEKLDIALADRFDIFLETDTAPEYTYFKKKYGAAYARSGVDVLREYQDSISKKKTSDKNVVGYWSPRRLDKLMEIFQVYSDVETVRNVLPSDVVVSAEQVARTLRIGLGLEKESIVPQIPLDKLNLVRTQMGLTLAETRTKSNAADFIEAYLWAQDNDKKSYRKLKTRAINALATRVGPSTLATRWKDVVSTFTLSDWNKVGKDWSYTKEKMMLQIRGREGWA